MTTGSKVNDQRRYLDAGTRLVGNYSKETWSGTDQTVFPAGSNEELVTVPPKYSYAKVPWAKERVWMMLRPGYSYRKNRLPKRNRAFDRHNYNKAGVGHRVSDNAYLELALNGSNTYVNYNSVLFNIRKPSTLWTSDDNLALLGQLRQAVVGSDFNPGIFLGESKQSLSMIGDAAVRLAKGYKLARKGNFPAAFRAMTHGYDSQFMDNRENVRRLERMTSRKRVASNWLEVQYGWFPLLQDMKSGAEFLAHNFSSPLQYRVSVQRYAGGSKYLWLPSMHQNLHTGVLVNNAAIYWGSGRQQTSRKLTAYFTERKAIQLSGLIDPWSVAWELVPYSFVLDWSWPIGNYLQTRGFVQALDAKLVSNTRNGIEVFAPMVSNQQSYAKVNPSRNGTGSRGLNWEFERYCSPSFSVSDVPLPSVRPLGKAVSWERAANALALVFNLSKPT